MFETKFEELICKKGPCQLCGHNFSSKIIGNKQRQFHDYWFDEYPTWLEYSIKKDVVYYLCCYLFKPHVGEQTGGDSFVLEGEKNIEKSCWRS